MTRRTGLRPLLSAALLMVVAAFTVASDVRADQVTFVNGDRISGEILSISDGKIQIATEYAGTITADFGKIIGLTTDAAGKITLRNGDLISGAIREVSPDRIVVESEALGILELPRASFAEFMARGKHESIEPVQTPGDDLRTDKSAASTEKKPGESSTAVAEAWNGSLAVGAQLQRGNTDTADLHVEIKAKRTAPREELHLRFYSDYGETEGETDQNKAFGQAKLKLFQTDRRYLFGLIDMEYDEMENLDLRAQGFGGIGYKFLNAPRTKLLGEAGAGLTGEFFDEADDEETLEASAFLNAEWTQVLFENVVFYQALTLFPNLSEIGDFRLRSETGVTSPLGGGWAFKLSLIDDYDSDPESEEAEKNDLRFISSLEYNF